MIPREDKNCAHVTTGSVQAVKFMVTSASEMVFPCEHPHTTPSQRQTGEFLKCTVALLSRS